MYSSKSELTGPPPQDSLAETLAGYDGNAAAYAARWGDLRLDRALHAFACRLASRRRVLDLGCGPGRDVGFLGRLGCQVVGLDLSSGMLLEARNRLPHATLVRADLRRRPLVSACFDGVWACASLVHLPRASLPAALHEVVRLLRRPAGVLYLALKAGRGERYLNGPGGWSTFFTFYQPAEVENHLQRTGLQVLESWVSPDQAGRDEPWINAIAGLGQPAR
jgi:SAM-dependent methyltransferase